MLAFVVVGLVWLLGLTSTIIVPVTLGAILATVAGPLVTSLGRHRLPRAAGAAVVLLLLLAVAVVVALMVFGGIYEQSSEIKASASQAVDKVEGWFNDAGAGGTASTTEQVKGSTVETGKALLQGVTNGIKELTSLVFFLTLNYAKILPYLWLGLVDRRVLLTAALLVPVGIAGIYAGLWMQRRIDVRWFYRLIYTLLFVTGSKLLYDGIRGL